MMNRKGFLGFFGGLVAAPFVGRVVAEVEVEPVRPVRLMSETSISDFGPSIGAMTYVVRATILGEVPEWLTTGRAFDCYWQDPSRKCVCSGGFVVDNFQMEEPGLTEVWISSPNLLTTTHQFIEETGWMPSGHELRYISEVKASRDPESFWVDQGIQLHA